MARESENLLLVLENTPRSQVLGTSKWLQNQNVRHQERLSVGVAHVLKGDLQFGQFEGVQRGGRKLSEAEGLDGSRRRNARECGLSCSGCEWLGPGKSGQKPTKDETGKIIRAGVVGEGLCVVFSVKFYHLKHSWRIVKEGVE